MSPPKIVVVVLLLGGVLALLVHSQRREGPLLVSGFVEADAARVGSRVGGRVARVLVEEGDAVEAGDLLVELEPFDLRARLAGAEAELAMRRARADLVEAGYRTEDVAQARAQRDRLAAQLARLVQGPREQEVAAGRARLAEAEADLELAELELERARVLRQTNDASEAVLDRAVRALRAGEASVEVRRQELLLLEEGTRAEDLDQARAELAEAQAALELVEAGYRPEEVAEARAAVVAGEAAVAVLGEELRELEVRAPVAGVVESLDVRPGDLVGRDAPILSLAEHGRLWVRAYVPQGRLSIALEDVVEVGVDAWPDERFRGRVSFIAREAEFTPRNVQTPEERSKQVFRIKVRLDEGAQRLRPGMACDLWLE